MMKNLIGIMIVSLGLAACGQADNSETPLSEPLQVSGLADDLEVDGKVLITVDRLIYEDAACLLMMDVINGTDQTVTAGLFTFNVTGNGETAGANMFPQSTEPGSIVTAQIVLPGSDCDNALLIEGGQLNCKITDTDESCMDVIELRDGAVDFTDND